MSVLEVADALPPTGEPEQASSSSPPDFDSIRSTTFESFEECFSKASSIAKAQGFALAVRRSSNYDPKTKLPTRKDIECVYGSAKETVSPGKRKINKTRCNCPWKAKAVFSRSERYWTFEVRDGTHSHPIFLLDTANLLGNRRLDRTPEIMKELLEKAQDPKNTAGEIVSELQNAHTGLAIDVQDVYNIRQRVKLDEAGVQKPAKQIVKRKRATPKARDNDPTLQKLLETLEQQQEENRLRRAEERERQQLADSRMEEMHRQIQFLLEQNQQIRELYSQSQIHPSSPIAAPSSRMTVFEQFPPHSAPNQHGFQVPQPSQQHFQRPQMFPPVEMMPSQRNSVFDNSYPLPPHSSYRHEQDGQEGG